MKFTIVFTTLLCVSTSWAVLAKKVEDPKDKRETPVGYGSALSSHSYQAPQSQGDASAISVGAGYSIGGAKPSYIFGGQGQSGAFQYQQEGLSPNGQASIQLAPITLQSKHGPFAAGDLSQIMSQLSHSLNAGGISLQPSTAVAEFHQSGSEGGQAQALAFPQYSYAAPNLQQYTQQYNLPESLSNAQSYSAGTKGLGSYSTGPVLFSPESQSQSNAAAAFTYAAPSSGHSFGDASGISFGGSGHGLRGLSFGGSGNSLGGAYKQLGASYITPSKNSFKPSAFLGASVQGDSGHGVSGLSGSYSAPSFGSFHGGNHGLSLGSAGGHGASFGGSSGGFGSGSIKYAAPSYQSSKPESGFGSSLEGLSSLSSAHINSPPGTTYGFPTASYSANNIHAASSNRPYYVSTKHHHHSSPSSFGEGSSSFRGPVTGHSSFSSSSGPKYSFGGSSSHYLPKDTQGAHSETSYNTIKYSEELKPRGH